MTSTIILKFAFQFLAIIFVSYLVYRQDDVKKFERKAWHAIKSFFFALRDVLADAKAKRRPEPKCNIVNIEYCRLLDVVQSEDFEINVA